MVQDFHEIGACAATGIEDIDVLVGEPIGEIEFLAKDNIHASHHVLDDFGRRVPNAELLAEFGIEGLEEGFVKILDSVDFLESGEEAGAVHAIEGQAGVVKDFREIELFHLTWLGDFMEQLAQDRNTEEAGGLRPVEAVFG